MPLRLNEETGEWEIYDLTQEEVESILEIGKTMIVKNFAFNAVNEKYKKQLASYTKEQFFNS